MIARVLRDSDSLPVRGGSYATNEPLQLRHTWWATSMVQYLQSIGKSITRKSIHHNMANQLIDKELFSAHPERQNTLYSLGITTKGELSMDCDNDEEQARKVDINWASH